MGLPFIRVSTTDKPMNVCVSSHAFSARGRETTTPRSPAKCAWNGKQPVMEPTSALNFLPSAALLLRVSPLLQGGPF